MVEYRGRRISHRIGQPHPVFVYRLVTEGTIEERILELKERKASLARAILDDHEDWPGTAPKGAGRVIEKADLVHLLAPIGR